MISTNKVQDVCAIQRLLSNLLPDLAINKGSVGRKLVSITKAEERVVDKLTKHA